MTATLEELKYEVAQCLKEGKKVHIDGLGYLQVTLSCEEEIRDPKDKRVHKVKLKAIKFKADRTESRTFRYGIPPFEIQATFCRAF